MTTELAKSIDEVVEATLANVDSEVVTLAPEAVVAEVIVKSEAPADKEPDADEDDKDADGKPKKKAKPSDKADKKDDAKADDKKPAFMKKSMDELKDILSEDELNVIEAWRNELAEEAAAPAETIVKSETASAPHEDLIKSFQAQMEDFKKSLTAKDDLIKSLADKLEVISAQPAHTGKAISDLSVVLEKSENTQTITKSFVLDTMFDLLKSGKGVSSLDITEYESSNKISNPQVRELVANACKQS